MKIITGGVTKPKGFTANGLHCGIKRSNKSDLALIHSQRPCIAACVFTKNSIKAAPVLVTQNHMRNNILQTIIANSGNANCFTGKKGMTVAQKTTALIAKHLKIKTSNVLVASTGIIGSQLPYKKIEASSSKLVRGLSTENGIKAAKAILTTDTVKKECAVKIKLNGKNVTIGGCAKGAGMIEPNMATMLCFITTDAAINAIMLKKALTEAVNESFNCITIDGCMSTNDMVSVIANGLAGNKKITSKSSHYQTFVKALKHVCLDLAQKIVRDGEGATKFVKVVVNGASSPAQAKEIAYKVANSNLVKTAVYGENPNWGRVAATVGALCFNIKEKDLKIKHSSFKKKNVTITISINRGKHSAKVYTSDLSLGYVKINAEYN